MTHETIERLHKLAERVVEKVPVSEPKFGQQGFDYLGDNFPRDLVSCVTDGRLRGQTFRTILPVAGEMFRDETYRELIIDRCKYTWRRMAISALVPMSYLAGPKGKLPQ